MINFDNSAGTFPKPPSVRRAVSNAMRFFGGNPGRGGHRLSSAAAEQVYLVRKKAASLFSAQPENVAFTPNCTFALNMALKGIMQYGGHMILSGYEHNAASRPAYYLMKERGVRVSVLEIYDSDEETLSALESLIRPDTLCVCMMAVSNVTGRILPYKAAAELCRDKGICFVCDGAQACGVLDISLDDGMSFLCTSGQKGLYGPTGTGLLISSGEYPLSTIIEGGTGTNSGDLTQPPLLPERLESGSLNTAGIIGLGAGIDFVRSTGISRIRAHEKSLCDQLEKGLAEQGSGGVYDSDKPRAPLTAFYLNGIDPEEASRRLSDAGFALRAGLHCAALAHETLGTTDCGALRFSPSAFNTPAEVAKLLSVIDRISA
ncbi:MAG: aminotransferase class V-fold PLP-dependent enzyme [Ruminococcus sp.]|nr:aminotransferase class V-fold PLP-dependent enzyme [Ruminococcus sp.]